ncbi:MAG: LacI family transcriptional regulator [Betaproteobacteria bacterium RIFCSPLOWO2_12_FULL_62_58]|nr:MAG: LacI family transcriptional regulator [Betaproteobacteria bacterium RIFCSPLOWO2_12_FULL_62_58]OGB24540.1 MAG: LacI family transcriptional regulator [Burkholderiales bacterium RIFCSPLOWO2_02_FULL_57_36]
MKLISWFFAASIMINLIAGSAAAQSYPNKPVRMMVPFPAGGGSDTMGRIVGTRLSERLGQQIVVENRPGAAGSIGADIVARAPADGYTILLGSTSELVQYPNVNPKIPYDPVRDFAPISLVGTIPLVLVVHPSLPVKNVKDLVALAKARPGEINFGSAGQGATTHLAVELFILLTGVKMTHVPYKGSPQAVADLVSGDVQLGIPTMPAALPFIRSGRVKVLAVSSAKRASNLPDIPSLDEAGVKGYDATLWTGMLAPAGTPKEIINRLHAEIAKVLALKEVNDALDKQGAEAQGSTPEQFAAFIKTEHAKWAKVVKTAGVRIE